MGSRQATADFLLEQIARAGRVSAKKMFGEYGIYCAGKIVALLCDDQLFLKQTEAGRRLIGKAREVPPYPGAKPHLLIEGDLWEDADWLSDLIRVTAAALPPPRPRIQKRKSKKGEDRPARKTSKSRKR